MLIFTDSCNRTQNVTVTKSDPVFWVEIVGLPLLVAICTTGNILNIIVMAYERPKLLPVQIVSKSTKVFLLAMAVSDMMLLWLQVPSYMAQYFQNISLLDNSSASRDFKSVYGAQRWGTEAFLQYSDWILIAFSVDRLRSFHNFARSFKLKNVESGSTDSSTGDSAKSIGSDENAVFGLPQRKIILPEQGRSAGTGVGRRAAVVISAVLFVFALVYAMENGVYYFYWQLHDPGDGTLFSKYRPDWLSDWNFFQNIFEVATTVAKFSALLLINIHLIVIIVVSQRRQGFPNVNLIQIHRNRRPSREKTGTNLLVGCLAVYFLTHFPNVVYQCLRLASSAPYCMYYLRAETSIKARPVVRVLLLSNYSVNFLLYYALSKKFRDELNTLPDRYRSWRRRLW